MHHLVRITATAGLVLGVLFGTAGLAAAQDEPAGTEDTGTQVSDLLNVDAYVQTHTALGENVPAPDLSGTE